MSKHSIMKNLDSEPLMQTADGFRAMFTSAGNKTRLVKLCSLIFMIAALVITGYSLRNFKLGNIETGETIALIPSPMASTAAKKDVITIPTGLVKANPFVPYRNLGNEKSTGLINDVPKFDLVSPPEDLPLNSEASKIMETVVSGILYDKYSPSAILNIEGNDYLVKKGDVIQNYKVVSILQDSVTVQSGKNTYKAGIGEFLTTGEINHNEISNLSKKFGGEKR